MKLANAARVVSLVIILLAGGSAWGQTWDWNDTAGGLFNDAANWTPAGGPPNTNVEDARFNLNNTYTVTFQADVINSNSIVDNGTVTFALSGRTYLLASGDGLTVGGVATQTGRVTLTNGTVSGDMDVGFTNGATGFVTVGSDAIFDASSNTVQVGSNGLGTLTISSGGRFTGTGFNAVNVGDFASSNGTLTVTGAGSSLTSGDLLVGFDGIGDATISSGGSASTRGVTVGNSNTATGALTVTGNGSSLNTNGQGLIVGASGVGDFTVSLGGTVTAGFITLGNSSVGSGSLAVTGPTSSITTSVVFEVGFAGAGNLEITGGGTVNAFTSRIAAQLGSTSSATVSGSGSTWNTNSLAIGGQLNTNGGQGMLTIADGATVNVSGETQIRNSSGSSLTIDGGTLVTGAFTRLGTFNFRDGTLHVGGTYDHGAAPAALVIGGATSGESATLRLSSNFPVQDVTSITVGNNNQGSLVLDGGRAINAGVNNISVGAGGLSSGTISVSGNSTSLTTAGTLSVGGSGGTPGGVGTVNIGAGATVDGSAFNLFSQGVVNLNGGTLRFGFFTPFGGSINFNAGEVAFATAVTVTESQLDAILGASHVLGAGRRLSGTDMSFNAPLTVSGGDVFSASSISTGTGPLQINAGSLVATTTLTNNSGRLLAISGTATVSAAGSIFNNGTIQLDENLIAMSGGTLTNNGTIRGSGFIGNNLTNNAAGQVQAATGHRLEFQGATNTNSGSISLVGGEIVFTGSLTNSAGTGLISGGDAILRVNGGITNPGSLAVTFGNYNVFGDINNTGSVVVSGGAAATFHDDIIQNGTFSVREVGLTNSTAVILGAFTGSGGSGGGGDIFFDGDLRPGNSPATVTFDNDIGFGSGVTLEIELGGTVPGTEYDRVHVTGSLSLDGTLDVSLIDVGAGLFEPEAGDSFDILNWASLTGTFDTIQLPTLSNELAWNTSQLYTTGVLSVVAPGVPGDYNNDGTANAADYVVWQKFNNTNTVLPNDPNPLPIDGDQYDTWRHNFAESGSGAGGGASSNAFDAVPEPTAVVLTLVGILLMFSQRCATV